MEIILTSIVAFASTNMDDIFILTLFYGDKKFTHRQILSGQLLGIGTLVAVSLAGSLAGLWIDPAYIGLLGLIPVYLGVKGLWQQVRQDKETVPHVTDSMSQRGNVLSVAGTTVANGGDNIGIYVPLFAAMTWAEKTVMIGIFGIMVALWCAIARFLVSRPLIQTVLERYGKKITPTVLVLLGIYILSESGTFGLLN